MEAEYYDASRYLSSGDGNHWKEARVTWEERALVVIEFDQYVLWQSRRTFSWCIDDGAHGAQGAVGQAVRYGNVGTRHHSTADLKVEDMDQAFIYFFI